MPIWDTAEASRLRRRPFPATRRAEQNVVFLIGKAETGARFDPAELTLDYCAQAPSHADG
jgi:hypothetical protein